MKKIRWGVLSTAKIGRTKVIPALQTSAHNEIIAICSRDEHSARKAADELGIARAYGSYNELLADPDVDAIYNPLPNHLHVEWSIKALEAGKHVLCEKPIGLSADDAQRLLAASQAHPELKVMEAFMYRFHPQWQKTKALIDAGAIGQLRTIHSHFAYNNRDADNIRNKIEMGGGALMDIGCYSISLSRWLFNAEPLQVMGHITPYEDSEVDCLTSGILEFDSGTATFTASTKIEWQQYMKASGDKGSIYIPLPFSPIADTATEIHLKRDDQRETFTLAPSDHYREMGDAFARSILNNQPVPTPLEDALANMRVIDAVFESAAEGRWIAL
ncbi:MAG TPA: Gfo/Idh/MocA family oxidoreductase [Cellvibrio sp.]|nr:Gfo/Idh/MocA family oxidoreductase [Cellvibrio sp.]